MRPAGPPRGAAGCADKKGEKGALRRRISGGGGSLKGTLHALRLPRAPQQGSVRSSRRCTWPPTPTHLQRSTHARSPMPTGRTAVTVAASYASRAAPSRSRCSKYLASARTCGIHRAGGATAGSAHALTASQGGGRGAMQRFSAAAQCSMRSVRSTAQRASAGLSVRSSTPSVPASSASSITRPAAASGATASRRARALCWNAATRFSAGMICGSLKEPLQRKG